MIQTWLMELSPARHLLIAVGLTLIVATDVSLLTCALLWAWKDWMKVRMDFVEWKRKRGGTN